LSSITLKRIIAFSLAVILLAVCAYNLWAYQGTILAPVLKDSNTGEPQEPLAEILQNRGIEQPVPDLLLEITKSQYLLKIYSGKSLLKSYKIALGKEILSDKEKAGDRRTPEGDFMITEKRKYSPPKRFFGSRLLLLNYPNREDALRGLHDGLITGKDFLAIEKAVNNNSTPPQDTPLGGGISIHGGGGPFMGRSWTTGSIGMYTKDIEEIFDIVPLYTRVVIKK